MQKASLLNAVDDVLAQGLIFLRALNSEAYGRQLEGAFTSPLGSHYRHVLDHFNCLLEGCRTGTINYDRRERNPELETSVEAARAMTEALRDEFGGFPDHALNRECSVVYAVGYAENAEQEVRSNLSREVMFCVGHAIHHYAILKLLCANMGVRLPYEFGVAPSTLKYLESKASA